MVRRLIDGWAKNPWCQHVVFYGLLLLLLIYPTSGFKNAVIWIATITLIWRSGRGGPRLHMGGLGIVVGAYGLIALLACFFSRDPAHSFNQWMKLFELIAGYFVVVNLLRTKHQVEINLQRYFLAAGTVALIDLARLGWGAWQTSEILVHGRWFDSLLGYPTIASGIYAASLLLGLPLLVQSVRRRGLWTGLTVALLMTGIVVLLYFLQTRSVLLGMLSGVFVIGIAVPLPRRYLVTVLAACLLIVVAFVAIPGVFQERILDADISDRTAIWADANHVIARATADEPHRRWIGFGYGHKTFETLHADLSRTERQAERVYNHAHNMFQETRIQMGYFGLAAWMALLGTAFYRLGTQFPARNNAHQRLVMACLAGSGVAFFIYGLFSLFFALIPAFFFWSLLAACMAYARTP